VNQAICNPTKVPDPANRVIASLIRFINERSFKAVFSSWAIILTLRFAAFEVESAALPSPDSCFSFVSI
jgi:hypothetical protein